MCGTLLHSLCIFSRVLASHFLVSHSRKPLPFTRIVSSRTCIQSEDKLMKNRRVDSITDFPDPEGAQPRLRPASKGRWDECTIWMARAGRVGCIDNASIYGYQPPRVQAKSSCRKTKMHSCRYLPLPPASLLLRVRASPCRMRKESACFERVREVCLEPGGRSAASPRASTRPMGL
ncbi:hypothetical protein C8R44DRAFT_240426 [Mycena epipterygia]|nr:hypothetical protein C8R44DRAFT_240426 [Mycena epipterygia]